MSFCLDSVMRPVRGRCETRISSVYAEEYEKRRVTEGPAVTMIFPRLSIIRSLCIFRKQSVSWDTKREIPCCRGGSGKKCSSLPIYPELPEEAVKEIAAIINNA